MGGSSAIRDECLMAEIPTAYKPLKDMPHTQDDVVAIDMHQKRFSLQWDGSTQLTGAQCCSFFIKMIERYQSHADGITIHAILMLWDKSAFVPVQKRRIQEKRGKSNEQRGLMPYSAGCQLGELGVLLPDSVAWIPIDTARLAITGYLLRAFANLLAEALIKRHLHTPFLATIIMDWQPKENDHYERSSRIAPLVLYSPALATSLGYIPANGYYGYDNRYANNIGEVDILVNHYLSTFVDKRIIVYSKDLDHLPIALLWLSNRLTIEWPSRFYWVQWEKHSQPPATRNGKPIAKKQKTEEKPLVYCDLLVLYNRLYVGIPSMESLAVSAAKERIFAFCLFYTLNDCDYYQKKNLSHQFGWRAIMQALCRAWPKLWKGEEDNELNYGAVGDIAAWHYENLLWDQGRSLDGITVVSASGTVQEMPRQVKDLEFYRTQLALNGSSKYKPATPSMLAEAQEELEFVWVYWNDLPLDVSSLLP
jgi:hypothetical protein